MEEEENEQLNIFDERSPVGNMTASVLTFEPCQPPPTSLAREELEERIPLSRLMACIIGDCRLQKSYKMPMLEASSTTWSSYNPR